MSAPRLHVLFTMDCQAPERKAGRKERRPKNWNLSGLSIESFSQRVLREGFLPTLFVSTGCAREQTPLLQELSSCQAEIGLLLNPQELEHRRYRHYLGHYGEDDQRAIMEASLEAVVAAYGIRPRSVRSSEFSANGHTYPLLHALGFTQSSLSSPGRAVRKYHADWQGALPDPHYTSPEDMLRRGELQLLEVPVTTDAEQNVGGLAPDLCVDAGAYESWHAPLLEGQVRRLQEGRVAFPCLCLFAHNAYDYRDENAPPTRNLQRLLERIGDMSGDWEIVPTTLAGAHHRFRDSFVTGRTP